VTKGRWILSGCTIVVLAIVAGAAALMWQDELAPISAPPAKGFERGLVKHGEQLAYLGGCAGCHTAPDGKPLAGGRAVPTPFGMILTTNITPDPSTGIGAWPRAAFVRAMREGVARDGHFLYPAFPYDHFTHASDDDLDALYAFLMSRPAIAALAPINRLDWPFMHRELLAGWNLLYLRKGPIDDGGNRGRALADGLAHCGSCHTPRNGLGAEANVRAYDGAWVDGWYAPPLNAHSPAAEPWTAEELFAYLRTGRGKRHTAAAGPMGDVTRALGEAPEADVRALADYFAGLMADAPASRNKASPIDRRDAADRSHQEGAALFAGACSSCHEAGAPMMQQGRPSLAMSTALREDAPHDTLHVILRGLAPPAGQAGPAMPAFGAEFTDHQLAEIALYIRARYTDLPPWLNAEPAVSEVRKGMGQ
jgi:mono/diheme cytochrome c family protein